MKKYLNIILLFCLLINLVSCNKINNTKDSSIYVIVEERKSNSTNSNIIKLKDNKKEDIANFKEIKDIKYISEQGELIFISEDNNLISINDDKLITILKENVNSIKKIDDKIYYCDNNGIYSYTNNESKMILNDGCKNIYDVTNEGDIIYLDDKDILKTYRKNSTKILLNKKIELVMKNGNYYGIYTKGTLDEHIYLYDIINDELHEISDGDGYIQLINEDNVISLVEYSELYCYMNNIEYTDSGTLEKYNLKTKNKEIITKDIYQFSSVKLDEDNNYYYQDINKNLIKYNIDTKEKAILKSNIASIYKWNNKIIYDTGKEIGFIEDDIKKVDDIKSSLSGVSIVDNTFSYINTLDELKVNEKVIDTGVNGKKVRASNNYVVYEKDDYIYYYDINRDKSYKLLEITENKTYKILIDDSFFIISK